MKGATRICLTSAPHPIYFNPRSREGSDAFLRRPASCPPTFQSTLPRRERRLYAVRHYQRCAISIHAPAKGATPGDKVRVTNQGNFNPRSREGSDGAVWHIYVLAFTFQSTLPRRERRCYDKGTSSAILISIHAPAKGATIRPSRVMISTVDFNPRSREGSDAAASLARYSTLSFQSTLP